MAQRRPLLPFLLAALACCAPGAGAAGEQSACTYAQVASFPLRYSGPGLQITLDGEIDGAPARLLADTGSFSIFLTMTGVQRRKLALHRTGRQVVGIGGNADVATTTVDDLAAGPVHSGKTEIEVITAMGDVPSYDAIIGAPFLLQADLEISLSDKLLKMYKGSGCDDTYLALWDEGSIDVPFHRGYRKGAIPNFTIQVNGRDMIAMLDTGASTSFIQRNAARWAGVKIDSPGVTPVGIVTGVGARTAPRWSAVFDSMSIGTETISKPELTIVDGEQRSDIDVVLGADFLRAHRVLFAISQGKLYVAYLGGEVFSHRKEVEPWMEREAEAGNADAQYVIGLRRMASDRAGGLALIEKAAANGSPYANLLLGRKLFLEGHRAEAEPRLKAALDQLPSQPYSALLLYLARLGKGDPALARRELEAAFERDAGAWPAPIAEFYLGRIGADELMAKAGADPRLAAPRSCDAATQLARWHRANGDDARAKVADESATQRCRALNATAQVPPPPKPVATSAPAPQ